MAAVAQLVSEDPQEQQSVAAVLRDHPELKSFMARVCVKAEDIFPESSFSVDTVRYDEWDAPCGCSSGLPNRGTTTRLCLTNSSIGSRTNRTMIRISYS